MRFPVPRLSAPMILAAALASGCAQTPQQQHPLDATADASSLGDGAVLTHCGDRVIDPGETCDDGNLLDRDGCDPHCQIEPGWVCVGEPSVCTSLCGNGALDDGEECEGANLDGQSCTSIGGGYTGGALACGAGCRFDTSGCILPGCGNGQVDAGEECDDGNTTSGDGCSASCTEEICGDGIVQAGLGEQCDDGNGSDTDDCPSTCETPRCGDGYAWSGHEACDDGNTASGDGCSASCTEEICGDGVTQAGIGEQCDDGNTDETDACTNACQDARCGDAHIWADHETCDDGNTTSGDGCSDQCEREFCGDGIVQSGLGEECDGDPPGSCTTSCSSQGTHSCTSGCVWTPCAPPAETCNAADDDCDGTIDTEACLNHIYRFYNATTGDHMFKANDTTPDAGYVLESHGFYLYATQVPNTNPFYQRYNPSWGDHMTTGDPTEGDSAGFTTTVTLGYIAPSNVTHWTAAGHAPSQHCRYQNGSVLDHYAHSEFPTGSEPAGYHLEYCGAWWWGNY